jgi:hypothetical protein
MSIWTSLASWAKSGAPSSQSVLNTGLTMLTNYTNRQRALADQKALNLYNSPQQQMQRFKEAGLNPNLIYKQTNEGAAVRSTDAIAPKIDETQLDVLAKSNNIAVQKLNLESMKLRNQNQQLQNEVLAAQLPDLKQKVGISNQTSQAAYDNLIEQVNLRRLERGQFGTKTELLQGQLKALTTNNKYLDASLFQKQEINELIKKNYDAIINGKVMENDLQKMDMEVRQELNQILDGLGSGIGGQVMKFLGGALMMFMDKKISGKKPN